MPANLTPQYLKAEEEYRRAATPEDELKWLQVMLQEIPKHKGTDKLQAELKRKLSEVKKQIQTERSVGRRARGVRIPRQGAGTVVILGGPNAGKSTLLKALTRANPEVAPYPFTTKTPLPGMMPWEDVFVQLIDTPPITADFIDPCMHGLIRSADLVLLMVDLGADEGLSQCQEVMEKLNKTKSRLAGSSYLDEEDVGLSYTRAFLVPNKIDLEEAPIRRELFRETLPLDWPEYVISAEKGIGLDPLREAIYKSLDVVRVYAKRPTAKEPDLDRPFTFRRGSTVADMASEIHKELAKNLKFARIWGSTVHPGTVVKGDYVLQDRDIVELHI